jgi:hypothetical protein
MKPEYRKTITLVGETAKDLDTAARWIVDSVADWNQDHEFKNREVEVCVSETRRVTTHSG